MKISVRKGLDINLKGEADKILADTNHSKLFALKPTDFSGLVPKMLVKEGDEVKCGSPVFCDKYNDQINYVSPVSGKINEIVRGEKRRILAVTIESDGKMDQLNLKPKDLAKFDSEEIKSELMSAGLWPFFRMRPIDIVALPNDLPKSIFISGFDSHPLAPDFDFIMRGKSAEFNAGLEIVSKLTKGDVNLQLRSNADEVFTKATNVVVNTVSGPHPAGNVGVQIHEIDTLNKGEVVWYINPQDVMVIGRFALTGAYDVSKIISVGGSSI